MKLLGRYKNGNYTVSLFDDGTKVRSTLSDKFIPKFAENCDVKITDCCDGGCAMCYEGCTPKGKHGDILNWAFLDSLHPYTEMAINGNDLSHPDLIEFLTALKERKVIANMTVNQIHFERKRAFIDNLVENNLIHGLGVSLNAPTNEFISTIQQYPNAVIHTINGVLTRSDVQALANHNLKILILGYKQLHRGVDYYNLNADIIKMKQRWLRDNLAEIATQFNVVSFDNLAIEQLNVRQLMSETQWEEFYMGNDGTMTFYIDMVEGQFGKNSLATKRHHMLNNIDDMFNIIVGNDCCEGA